MKNWIDLFNAVAWPLAAMIIAVSFVVGIWIIATRRPDLSFQWGERLKLGTSRSPSPVIAVPDSRTASSVIPAIDPNETAARDNAVLPPEALATASEPVSSEDKESFFETKSPERLAALFDEFKQRGSYTDQADFWDSYYIVRRAELGIGDPSTELETLARANIKSVWPLIFLARAFARQFDFKRAEEVLNQALSRDNVDDRKYVLADLVRLNVRTGGVEQGYRYVHGLLTWKLSDFDTAHALRALADESATTEEKTAGFLLKEMSLCYHPKQPDLSWDLAYNVYGSDSALGLASYHHYQPLFDDTGYVNARNNAGTIVDEYAPRVQLDFFERAMDAGSARAAGNLANYLVDAGFVRRAEEVIKLATDPSDERVLQAQQAVASAKRAIQEAVERFEEYVSAQFVSYRETFGQAFRHFRETGAISAEGSFHSKNVPSAVTFIPDGAMCELSADGAKLAGTLPWRGLAYEGTLSSGSGLLSQQRRAMVFVTGTDTVKLLVWPSKTGSEPIIAVDLNRKASAPAIEPLPPPAPPTS